MTAVAADVPNKFDVVLNGEGYQHADLQDIKAEYGYIPTFITRQNTQGDFGDNQQDFWLTATQRDWSLGEQQRFFRQGNEDSIRRYWLGTNLDLSIPGQVSMNRAVTTATVSSTSTVTCRVGVDVYFADATKLYFLDQAGTVTDAGAHGLGAAPVTIASDGRAVYLSTTAAGTVGVRKYVSAAFTTFSASGADRLCFLNNTLYGYRSTAATGDLVRYDTAGTLTSIYTWKGADGTVLAGTVELAAFGGKLAILRAPGTSSVKVSRGAELYVYESTAPALAAEFPPDFVCKQGPPSLVVVAGTIFVSGGTYQSSTRNKPTIYYYSSGTIGKLWQSTLWTATDPTYAISTAFRGGLLFADEARGQMMFYEPSTGGISSFGTYTALHTGGLTGFAATFNFAFLIGEGSTNGAVVPGTSQATTSTVITSLFDFDSSLSKLIRGIKVEFDSATDGDGGTVDIAYRADDVDGNYTNLKTGATSGAEYPGNGTNIATGRSLSVKVTLNKGTSTLGPVLKRIAVRAAPVATTGPGGAGFRKVTLVLLLVGKKEPLEGGMMETRDGRSVVKSGEQQADDLFTAASTTTPFSVTTELHGTISSCLIDQENFKVQRIRKNEYIAYVPIREV